MPQALHIAVPDYYKQDREAETFSEFTDLFTPKEGPLGLWALESLQELASSDSSALLRDRQIRQMLRDHEERLPNGRVRRHALRVKREHEVFYIDRQRHVTRISDATWCKNVITDIGATAMLKNTWYASGSQIAIFNQIAITTDEASTTLTTNTGTSAITTLSVAALPKAYGTGLTMTIGYGTGTTQTVTLNGNASAGATSITVNSFTPSIDYPAGTFLVPIPLVTDNPSSLGGTSAYSGAITSGHFAYSGTGAGSRQVIIDNTFNTSTTAGSYRGTYTTNANPVASGSTGSHLIHNAKTIDSTTSLLITETLKV